MNRRIASLALFLLLTTSAVSTLGCHALTTHTSSAAALSTHALIADNMVLQRGVKAPIRGWAKPGETVVIALNGHHATARADAAGRWKAEIGPLDAGGPYDMTITGAGTSKTVSNVAVGDVWVCSGQSNMEMPMRSGFGYPGVKNYKQEVAAANYPMIRMFSDKKQVAGKPLDNTSGSWTVCSPESVPGFSATAYFFARGIHKNLNVPVGLIVCPWGGMPAQAFTSREALQANPELKTIIEQNDAAIAEYPAKLREYLAQMPKWSRSASKAEAAGIPIPPAPAMPADPRTNPGRPAGLYNAMIAPTTSYAIKGAIWYQGESNAVAPEQYYKLFPAMITDWRHAWNQGDFPFLFVQLANYDATGFWTREYSWAGIREAQLQTLALPNTGMAVAADIGESKSIHPMNKQDVGHRLALAARAIAYGQKVDFSGPIYDSMAVKNSSIQLRFKHANGGLTAKDADGKLSAGVALKTFFIAGADKKFVPAEARIEGDTVVVSSPQVPNPVSVRYAWSNDPVGCNLYNAAGLPASPFRTGE